MSCVALQTPNTLTISYLTSALGIRFCESFDVYLIAVNLRRWHLSRNRKTTLLLCIGSFLSATLAILPFVETQTSTRQQVPAAVRLLPWITTSLILACLLAVLAYFTEWPKFRPWALYLLPSSGLIIGIARTLGIPKDIQLKQYGDTYSLENFITDRNLDFGRWLLGLTLLREIFETVNAFLFVVDIGIFVRLTGTLLMAGFGMWFVSRKTESIAPWLLTISPIWVLFSVGYSEYYPFIVGLIAVTIWQIVSNQQIFHTRTSYLLVGILPALYIGTVPVSAALLLHTWSRETVRRERVRGLAFGLASFIVSIEIGGEFKGYAQTLRQTIGLEWDGSGWLFFNDLSIVFSIARVVDIWFWLSCATGIVCLSLPLVLPRGLGLAVQEHNGGKDFSFSEPRMLVASRTLLLLASIIFLMFMNPMLGVTQDIDLYFMSYLTLLLLLANRLDLLVACAREPVNVKRRIMQVTAFSVAPATTALIVFGVSR